MKNFSQVLFLFVYEQVTSILFFNFHDDVLRFFMFLAECQESTKERTGKFAQEIRTLSGLIFRLSPLTSPY